MLFSSFCKDSWIFCFLEEEEGVLVGAVVVESGACFLAGGVFLCGVGVGVGIEVGSALGCFFLLGMVIEGFAGVGGCEATGVGEEGAADFFL